MTRTARFSFLTAGPTFKLELPDELPDLPELSSPLSWNDEGGLSYDFIPAERDKGIPTDDPTLRVLDTLRDRDGRAVDFFQHVDPPLQWYLRWHLSNGFLYTHLREGQPDRAPTLVTKVGIAERPGLPPVLLPERPVGRGVAERPGYHEVAVFRSQREGGWTIALERPGFLREGKVMRDPREPGAVLRGGARYGIEVMVGGTGDVERAKERMSLVLDSLDEAEPMDL